MSTAQTKSIILSAEEVRCLLDGTLLEIRRDVKPQPPEGWEPYSWGEVHKMRNGGFPMRGGMPIGIGWGPSNADGDYAIPSPFVVGAELWVKEKCIQVGHERTMKNGQYVWPHFVDAEAGRRWFDQCCEYAADLDRNSPLWIEPHGTLAANLMPQWASRLSLTPASISVEQSAKWQWVLRVEKKEQGNV